MIDFSFLKVFCLGNKSDCSLFRLAYENMKAAAMYIIQACLLRAMQLPTEMTVPDFPLHQVMK